MNRISITGVARVDRLSALEGVSQAMVALSGCVIDANFFSDLFACVVLELPAPAAGRLAEALTERGVSLDDASVKRLAALPTDSDADPEIALALSFPSGTGDLRHTRPAVPG